MITENSSPHIMANRIKMHRTQHSGAFLLLEGPKDKNTYSRHVNKNCCMIEICNGKDNVLKTLEILEKDKFSGVSAIVDADFWHFDKAGKASSSNVHITDGHDLESMIFNSPAFEKILAEYASPEKLEKIQNIHNLNLKQILTKCTIPLGYLRWISLRRKLHLKFDGLRYNKFINNNLEINIHNLIETVKNKSSYHGLNTDGIFDEIEKFRNSHKDEFHICCGHDLCEMFSFALKVIGKTKDDKESIEKNFRLAYENEHFKETKLYKSVKNWENINDGFRVFL